MRRSVTTKLLFIRNKYLQVLFQLRRLNDKLTSCTKDLRRKLRLTQSQLHLLVDERADLTAKVRTMGQIAAAQLLLPWGNGNRDAQEEL